MTSITIAVSDEDHHVPGLAVEAFASLFCMHDRAVREWITGHRGLWPSAVVVADPSWVNPGDGTESLTFPVVERDAEAVAARWAKSRTNCRAQDQSDA